MLSQQAEIVTTTEGRKTTEQQHCYYLLSAAMQVFILNSAKPQKKTSSKIGKSSCVMTIHIDSTRNWGYQVHINVKTPTTGSLVNCKDHY